MAVHKIPATQAVTEWPRAAASGALGPLAIDVRSPAEFALDHLPLAHNWPVLDDAQRAEIGTLYKTVSPFEASKRGAAWVSENIARILHEQIPPLDRNWKPYVYCWRGGQRSGSLSHVLGQVGFSVRLIEGGYKAFRAAMLDDLALRVSQQRFVVLHGATGCGKTRLLQHLHQQGAQVLDLEALAEHRSSVLGQIPGIDQPSQKQFDMRLWQSLRTMDPEKPVFVEAESKRVGAVTIHPSVFERMQAAPLVAIEAPLAARVELLCEDYAHFIADPPSFTARLAALKPLVGAAVHDRWLDQCDQGDWSAMVADLLERHYDPNYRKAGERLYPQTLGAPVFTLTDLSGESLFECAQRIRAKHAA